MNHAQRSRIATLATGLLTITGVAFAGSGPHWGYAGPEGPVHWGELDQQFVTCQTGKNQSPVDLAGFVTAELEPIAFHYVAGGVDEVNNGHTIQVNYEPGSSITVNGHEYALKQFHFHTPSENHISGKAFPMEAHLVHADADGNLAVVALMFEQGAANPALADAWAGMPTEPGAEHRLANPASAGDLLPAERDYYRFDGSLTTPPCSEGVVWLVMKQPVSASKEQIQRFAEVMGHPNNRPIQPLNARVVLQ